MSPLSLVCSITLLIGIKKFVAYYRLKHSQESADETEEIEKFVDEDLGPTYYSSICKSIVLWQHCEFQFDMP